MASCSFSYFCFYFWHSHLLTHIWYSVQPPCTGNNNVNLEAGRDERKGRVGEVFIINHDMKIKYLSYNFKSHLSTHLPTYIHTHMFCLGCWLCRGTVIKFHQTVHLRSIYFILCTLYFNLKMIKINILYVSKYICWYIHILLNFYLYAYQKGIKI